MIGVFDSGHGGLTILRALTERLPDRDFLYFGDHANAPYGDRTPAEVIALTRDAVAALFARGCRLVLLACNTAAAVALRTLQQDWLPMHAPDHRILGVLVPTVEGVTGEPWRMEDRTQTPREQATRRLIVFATRRTVASNAYPEEIHKRAPEINVIQHACTGLVQLIEAGASRAVLREAVRGHVSTLMSELNGHEPDAVMLGCTHYPLVADMFVDALPQGIEVVSQPDLVAASLSDYLRRRPDIDVPRKRGKVSFLTSGDAEEITPLASTFFGRDAAFQKI